MPRPGKRWIAITLAVIAGLLIVAAGATAYATMQYSDRYEDRLLPGTTVAGVAVGGMDEADARSALETAIAPQLDREITLKWRDREWTVTPRDLGARSNLEWALRKAFRSSETASFTTLARMRLLGDLFDYSGNVRVRYSRNIAAAYVRDLARSLDRDPRDAELDYSSGWVKFEPEHEGREVLTGKSHKALMGALRGGSDQVDLQVKVLQPGVTRDAFEQVLLLHIGENRLYLYDNGKIAHSWTVATGQPAYPTPTGLYEITEKRYMPTWVNPDPQGWGASMPPSIPPGPGNPLGTRALNWSASGIRFHGTEATYSLGHNASHGCVRMAMSDVENLYDMVDVGTPIVSVNFGSYDTLLDTAQNN
jgi:lipoprotein-anchoring transpeptidase ErfK/SrfK